MTTSAARSPGERRLATTLHTDHPQSVGYARSQLPVPVYSIGRSLAFPPPEHAEDGLLAVGGDLSAARLLLAYRSGIFPWYDEDLPILWHSPDPRCVLVIERLHIGRTLRRVLTQRTYDVRFDSAFERVIRACKATPRPGQDGTWITDDMERAYIRLHRMGYAHSIEAWQGQELVGGVYGVSLGRIFFGESMFSWQPNASKVALVALAERVAKWGFRLIDAQVATPNTLAMGAEEWPRPKFLDVLREEVSHPTRKGCWTTGDPELEAPDAAFSPSRE
jgi:leucyl/phenylalanyl-tRNA--protein transferase